MFGSRNRRRAGRRTPLLIAAIATLPLPACTQPSAPATLGAGAAELRAAGPHAALTIYPVYVLERLDGNVADALGLVLEKHGMDRLESAATAFDRPADTAWEDMPAKFAEFLKQSPPSTPYALYAEFLGEPKHGPTEVRWLIMDAAGALAFSDRQTPADPDFRRTAARDPDPLGCSVLVAERLFAQAGWKKRSASATEGRFARKWAEKSGMPDQQEQTAMQGRLAALRRELASSRFAVYPTMVNGTPDAASAARLTQLLARDLGCGGVIEAKEALGFALAPTSNQQKRLWDLARGFREHLRVHRAEADYALVAEFAIKPAGGPAHLVHLVVCDRDGAWIVADFQNDQHAEFQRINPQTVEDCERLLVQRLRGIVR